MTVCGLARPRLVGLGYPLTGYSSDGRDSTLLGVSAVSGKQEHTTFFDRPTGVDNQERVVNLVHGTGDRDQLITRREEDNPKGPSQPGHPTARPLIRLAKRCKWQLHGRIGDETGQLVQLTTLC